MGRGCLLQASALALLIGIAPSPSQALGFAQGQAEAWARGDASPITLVQSKEEGARERDEQRPARTAPLKGDDDADKEKAKPERERSDRESDREDGKPGRERSDREAEKEEAKPPRARADDKNDDADKEDAKPDRKAPVKEAERDAEPLPTEEEIRRGGYKDEELHELAKKLLEAGKARAAELALAIAAGRNYAPARLDLGRIVDPRYSKAGEPGAERINVEHAAYNYQRALKGGAKEAQDEMEGLCAWLKDFLIKNESHPNVSPEQASRAVRDFCAAPREQR